MKKRIRYNFLPVAFLLLLGWNAGAQGVFSWRAPIDSVASDGFYQIRLDPVLVAKSKTDLADVRILGPGGRFVSYVLKDSRGSDSAERTRLSLPPAVMVQKDSSDKRSYIDLLFSEAYEIDWLLFVIRDPVFYKREAQLFVEGAHPGEWTSAAFITLSPGNGMVSVPVVKSRHLRVAISNADNAPLVVREVMAFQASRWLIAYLKAAAAYEVLTGNTQAGAPEYDLRYFTDSLKTTPPILAVGSGRQASFANEKPVAQAGKGEPVQRSGLLLWIILFVILILLVYFSVKLAREIR
jgi:hypothetical protein